MPSSCAATAPYRVPIIIGSHEPIGPGQHGDKKKLRRKLGAALGTTVREDGAAGAGTHAKTEAVNLRAATVVGLERSLAHGVSPSGSRCAARGAGRHGWKLPRSETIERSESDHKRPKSTD